MENIYFRQYIADIDRIIQEAREEYTKASITLGNARNSFEAIKYDRTASNDKRAVAAATFREAEAAHRNSVETIQKNTEMTLKALRGTFAKHLAEYTTADPEKVDHNAVMLMNSGMMSERDLVALANKYTYNPTMLKMVAGQAEKLKEESRLARELVTKIAAYNSPTERLQLFDTAVSVAMRTIQSNTNIARSFQKSWDEEYYPGIHKAMSTLEEFSMETDLLK